VIESATGTARGDAIKLTTYFGERARADGRLLADELLDLHARHAIRLSVLLRGIQGFGAKHSLRTDRLLTLSEDLPLVSVAIDAPERIERLRQQLAGMEGEGLVTLERARLAGGHPGALPPAAQVKLTVCVGRHERVDGEPAFAAACRALHEAGVAGATVLLGVDGTVAGERRRARFFAANRGIPLLVLSVGAAEAVERAVDRLTAVLPSALYTTERIQVCKRDGILLAAPSARGPGRTEHERQKLTVVVSEAARHSGRPVYQELVRRLRAAGAAGATSLRGIWGFHGEHAPHGDRLLALRRRVPVVTELIDAPARVAELFAVVDGLTSERGLVTVEPVPVSFPLAEASAQPPAL
jgi:PII-like signaling protein